MNERIEDAVRELYRVFRDYRFTAMEGDAASPGLCDPAPLLAHPLEALPPEALKTFAWKSVSTWGTADDLRHFLPRMLELAAEFGDGLHLETWALFSKLSYAGWLDWPEHEKSAIEDYVIARWLDVLYMKIDYEINNNIQPMRPFVTGADRPRLITPHDYMHATLYLKGNLIDRLLALWTDGLDAEKSLTPAISLAEVFLQIDAGWDQEPYGSYFNWLKDPRRVEQLASCWQAYQEDQKLSQFLSDGLAAAERWQART